MSRNDFGYRARLFDLIGQCVMDADDDLRTELYGVVLTYKRRNAISIKRIPFIKDLIDELEGVLENPDECQHNWVHNEAYDTFECSICKEEKP